MSGDVCGVERVDFELRGSTRKGLDCRKVKMRWKKWYELGLANRDDTTRSNNDDDETNVRRKGYSSNYEYNNLLLILYEYCWWVASWILPE